MRKHNLFVSIALFILFILPNPLWAHEVKGCPHPHQYAGETCLNIVSVVVDLIHEMHGPAQWPQPLMLQHVADIEAPIQAGIKWIDCIEDVPCIFPGPHVAWEPYHVSGTWVDTGVDISGLMRGEVSLAFISFPYHATLLPLNMEALSALERASDGDVPIPAFPSFEYIEGRTGLAIKYKNHVLISEGIYIALGVSHEGHLLVAWLGFVQYKLTNNYNLYYTVIDNSFTPDDECQSQKLVDEFVVCAGDTWPMPSLKDLTIPEYTVIEYNPIRLNLWQLGVQSTETTDQD